MQRDVSYLADIVDAAQLIQTYLEGFDFDEFFEDLMRQDAVVRELMVIGEAAKQLSIEFKDAHADVPWRSITGTRNVLVHAYRDVDVKEVWRIATVDVPQLLSTLEPLLPPPPE